MIEHYIGLDVGQKKTAICIIDKNGKKLQEGACNTRPTEIYGWIKNRIEDLNSVRVGLEAGTMSSWITTELLQCGVQTLCMETFQAHRFLATYRNKTDKNDARGLAQLLRMGGEDFVRVVAIKSAASQETRTMLNVRSHLVKERVQMENHISGILKPYGVIVKRGVHGQSFRDNVELALSELQGDRRSAFKALILPLLDIYMQIFRRIAKLTTQIETIADNTPMVKRFMTIPGVGPITALSFYASVDYPERFRKSSDVGAYFGLTPKQFQSGESNFYGNISKRGDPSTRQALVQAATVLLYSTNKWCSLKAWGVRLAKRIGYSKARVAVARKLAIIMHKIWINETRYIPKKISIEEIRALKDEQSNNTPHDMIMEAV